MTGEYRLAADIHTVSIQLPTGNLSVVVGEEGRVKIREGRSRLAADRAEDFEILKSLDFVLKPQPGSEPGVLRLGTPSLPAGLNPKKTAMIMRVLIEVPPGISVDLETGRGHMSVVDRKADIRVRTGSGDLNFRRNEGNLAAFTGLGECLVEAHRGGLSMETVEGGVIAYLDAVSTDGLKLRAQTGSIQCKLPRDLAFDLDLRTDIGEARSAYDLPITQLDRGMSIRGKVGNGGTKVSLWSGRGNVSVAPKH